MLSDLGKLFIGGISWDTNEDRLREYFRSFGEVVEAVIMKDRTTGRARGFGFVVFADPAVAERVVLEKHTIDGRTVEAKKAVPKEDQNNLSRNNTTVQGSPGPSRTKKIFVGGLPSTVTDADFKKHFEQFGDITDVVVMYDHNTHRPRGFGFITFESEDAVDRALFKNFHELNGKMVEVKRAIPKELSPGLGNRSPSVGYSHSLSRTNSFINGYTRGFDPNSINGYGMRMDVGFGPLANSRNGYPPPVSPGYGIGTNFETGFSSGYGASTNYNNSVGYGRGINPFYSGNSSRFNYHGGYTGGNVNAESLVGSMSRNVWGNGGLSYAGSENSNSFMTSGNGGIGSFLNDFINWDVSSTSVSAQGGRNASSFTSGNLGFANDDNRFSLGAGFGRNAGTSSSSNSFGAHNSGFDRSYGDLYGSNSIYGDPTWRSGSSDIDGPGSFHYASASEAMPKGSTAFVDGYNISNIQHNRGIAP